MTNDEIRMTKEARNPNDQRTRLTFVLCASSFIRHSSFVIRHFTAVALGSTLMINSLAAAEQKISASDLQFFEGKIRPILSDNCYKCHSAGAEKIKGGLLLDTRDGALKGGNTGPAVVPGNLEKSLLIKAIH